MLISDVIVHGAVVGDLKSTTKSDVLDEMASLMASSSDDLSREDILSAVLERERLGSTGIGYGVAIPHGKVSGISRVYMAFGRSKSGIDFDSMDDKPAYLYFMIIAPIDASGAHLKTLSAVSTLLKEESFRSKLLNAASDEDLYTIITSETI